jgi:hypothetical protein
MSAAIYSPVTVGCENIKQVVPAIEFFCDVDGRVLKASLTHVEDNGVQFIYHISFSDGHVGSFMAPLEAGRWYDEGLSSAYAKAIHDDLNAFCGFLLNKPPFCIRLKSEKEAFNVWIVPSRKTAHYSVYYKGDYRFELRKKDCWEVNSVREGAFIDEAIASIVCKNIDRRISPLLFH